MKRVENASGLTREDKRASEGLWIETHVSRYVYTGALWRIMFVIGFLVSLPRD